MSRDELVAYGVGTYGKVCRNFAGIRNYVLEVNHTPARKSYEGTPYRFIVETDMPASIMPYEDHRLFPSTGLGTNKITGRNADEYRKRQQGHLKNNEFGRALEMDIIEELRIDSEHYKPYIIQKLNYLKENTIPGAPDVPGVPKGKLMNEQEYNRLMAVVSNFHL